MKLMRVLIAASFILTIVSACSNKDEKTLRTIETISDYQYFSTVEELVWDADTIVIGTVSEVHAPKLLNINIDKTIAPLNEVYTVSDIKVEEVIKGSIPNETIQLKQAGGIYENVRHVTDKIEFVKKDHRYLFFLISFVEETPNEPYVLLNPEQAMVVIDGNKTGAVNSQSLFEQGIVQAKAISEISEAHKAEPPKKVLSPEQLQKIEELHPSK